MKSIFGFTALNCKSRRKDAIKMLSRIKQMINIAKQLGATIEIVRSCTECYSEEWITVGPSTKTENAIRIELHTVEGTFSGTADETEIDNAITRITKDIEIEKANYELMEKIEKEMEQIEKE